MNHSAIIAQLAGNAAVFRSLLEGLSYEQVRWKPAPDKWSILEVVNHLHDEEREDFRFRLQLLLNNSQAPWPPIAPERWAVERRYAGRNFAESLEHFLAERRVSIEWLSTLSNPQWHASYRHPQMGPISAEMLLANWLAHDYLHMRQILRLKYAQLEEEAAPHSLVYAGNW